jgi:nickel/cobalt exporter
MQHLYALQAWLREAVNGELAKYAADRNLFVALSFLPAGIFFGAVHALTPGHGKAVLASYVLGSRLSVLRSLAVSCTLAVVHILSSVILSSAMAVIVTRTVGGAGRAPSLEFFI